MEVDRSNFANLLPTVLKRIAESDFIAFDLEFSGIPPQRQRDVAGKATLQDRYEDVKVAAETYHVHQFGLTCAEKLHRHNDDRQYSLRAFNFHISPLIAENLGVDRKFSYSSSAVQFLMGSGHRMETPFLQGIPYLSREEEKTVAEQAKKKSDRSAIPDIVLRDDDKTARDLVDTVKRDVQAWINEKVCDFCALRSTAMARQCSTSKILLRVLAGHCRDPNRNRKFFASLRISGRFVAPNTLGAIWLRPPMVHMLTLWF